jgi:hypothetical protein
MRVLFVVPSEVSTGEAITALHAGRALAAHGGASHFLGSSLAAKFIAASFPNNVEVLGTESHSNHAQLESAIRRIEPHAILFADLPLLWFRSGVAPFEMPRLLQMLAGFDGASATFDHLGYAQRRQRIFFGPPHVTLQFEDVEELPEWVHVLLPCPMNSPQSTTPRRGVRFRYLPDAPSADTERTHAVRRAYGVRPHEYLVTYATPGWAQAIAQRHNLAYPQFVAHLLAIHMRGADKPVTMVMVNGGNPHAEPVPGFRTIAQTALSPAQFRELLAASDLFVTDNAVSSALGAAVCSGTASARLRNEQPLHDIAASADPELRSIVQQMERQRPGSVFPFDVFPIWNRDDLAHLGILHDNPIEALVNSIEVFAARSGGGLTPLLCDTDLRTTFAGRQKAYADAITALPDAYVALERCIETQGVPRS